MKDLLLTLALSVLVLIIFLAVIILIGYGLHLVMEYIPCSIIAYIETGLLLGLFMLLINSLLKKK